MTGRAADEKEQSEEIAPRRCSVAIGVVRFGSTEIAKAVAGDMRRFRAWQMRHSGH
jgi:hypothetical protein